MRDPMPAGHRSDWYRSKPYSLTVFLYGRTRRQTRDDEKKDKQRQSGRSAHMSHCECCHKTSDLTNPLSLETFRDAISL